MPAPFAIASVLFAIRWGDMWIWPSWSDLSGTGQLLLPSIALLVGGIKELLAASPRSSKAVTDSLLALSFVMVAVIAAVYGYVAAQSLNPPVERIVSRSRIDPAMALSMAGLGTPINHMSTSVVAWISLAFVGVSITLAVSCIMAASVEDRSKKGTD